MKRIIIHWTGGTNQPNLTDFEHYHYLINGDGMRINGKYPPEANLNCKNGKYAAHTEMGNTGSIGVALCGMMGYTEGGKSDYPLTMKQCLNACEVIAQVCLKYDIAVTPQTVLTHYEFDCNRGKPGRKIDIIHLPPFPEIPKNEVGNFFRERVKRNLFLV